MQNVTQEYVFEKRDEKKISLNFKRFSFSYNNQFFSSNILISCLFSLRLCVYWFYNLLSYNKLKISFKVFWLHRKSFFASDCFVVNVKWTNFWNENIARTVQSRSYSNQIYCFSCFVVHVRWTNSWSENIARTIQTR